jgi:hypothetical protein
MIEFHQTSRYPEKLRRYEVKKKYPDLTKRAMKEREK